MVKGGKRIVPKASLDSIREFVEQQLSNEVWEEEQRFENPHVHYLDMSLAYYQMKMDMLNDSRVE